MLWKDNKFWLWLEIVLPSGESGGTSFNLSGSSPNASSLQCAEEVETNTVCFELVRFGSDFEVNAIPTASVSIALGRRADDVTKVSEIHNHLNDLKLQLKARVWCLATTLAGAEDPIPQLWPSEKFLVFEGYATGSGFRRGPSGAEFVLGLTHWLTDLNFSSSLSRQTHPLSNGQLWYPANYTGGEQNAGGASSVPAMLTMPYLVDPTVVINDIWGGAHYADGVNRHRTGIRDFLASLTRYDRLNAAQIRLATNNTVISEIAPQINWEACRALQRFEPNSIGPGWVETGYNLGVPLGLGTAYSQINTNITNAVMETVGGRTFESYQNSTLWDKLAGQFHSEFIFSVIPLIRKALVVPLVPGLARTDDALVHRVIRTTQYESIDLSAIMPRPLRAVGLFINQLFAAGSNPGGTAPPNLVGLGGWYDRMTVSDDPRYGQGLILFKQGPGWATHLVNAYQYTQNSTGVTNGVTVNTTAGGAGGAINGNPPAVVLQNAMPMWTALAKSHYINESLKQRQGTITGPVRFDIAPGSTIKVEVTEDEHVKQLLHTAELAPGANFCLDDYFTFFYGTVLRVSTTIDCQSMAASTTFHMSHIRSETENADPGLVVDRHPVWAKHSWGGCVLVDDPVYIPTVTKREN